MWILPVLAPAVAKAAAMEHESTTIERGDAISGSLERFFESSMSEKLFGTPGEAIVQALPR